MTWPATGLIRIFKALGGDPEAGEMILVNPRLGVTPIGAIIAWHKAFANTPTLSDGWIECNGQTLSDSESVYDGQVIPDLNGDGRFIRGSATSGVEEVHTVENHKHAVPFANSGTAIRVGGQDPFGAEGSFTANRNIGLGTINTGDTYSLTNNIASAGKSGETRPINISMVWIMRVK